ncbi:MAG: sulfatase-like hydrolase/transferase [Bacteroidetes bacterium]|nr:sulfatase-like hydrolase/transferase [Bacteroidota bacterium]
MRTKFLHIIKTTPVFLYLLPVFFVLHGCVEHYDHVPFKDAALLTGMYIGFSLLFAGLAWLVCRNFTRANLFALLIMAFHFFFGSIYDFAKKIAGDSFITKYSFILPFALLFFIAAFIWIKKRKSGFSTTRYYLNVLLLLLILADTVLLTNKMMKRSGPVASLPSGFTACDTCNKPDIYFILADEYAGNTELKEQFGFDNQAFPDSLSVRGFQVAKESHSNYNYTPFSMASILNMDYLKLEATNRNMSDLSYCYSAIENNTLLRFLQYHQYQFYNYSIFDFEGQPGRRLERFLPVKTRLITAQTFLSRAENSILFNIVTRFRSKAALRKLTYAYKENNERILELTREKATQSSNAPRFIYAHLELPHYPYYYDKDGNEQPFEKLTEGNQVNKAAYIGYLQYSNSILLQLIDHIRRSSARPPIIVLMGDHGFRHFTQPVEKKYYFNNLSAVLLPPGNSSRLPDTLTSVNLFRSLLNVQFHQSLPMLRDSMVYLKD